MPVTNSLRFFFFVVRPEPSLIARAMLATQVRSAKILGRRAAPARFRMLRITSPCPWRFEFFHARSGCFGTASDLIGRLAGEFELYFFIYGARPSEEMMLSAR
jgi:hypothetical protein